MAQATYPSGSVLGGYLLGEVIGSGGSGTVYAARDADQRAVALKLLHPIYAADPESRRRLSREAAAMRRLQMKGVAKLVDVEFDSAEPFIVTELVDGKTLSDSVATEGPFRPDELADLAANLLDTLTAIHQTGMVHRDLKPGNVMITGSGPVLIDFGIATDADQTRLTAHGMVIGTPGYLAPELLDGQSADAHTDLWSMAATLVFAATGRPPYGTGPFEVVLSRVKGNQPDLAGLPAPLASALAGALNSDPHRRIGIEELVAELDRYAAETSADQQLTARVCAPEALPPTLLVPEYKHNPVDSGLGVSGVVSPGPRRRETRALPSVGAPLAQSSAAASKPPRRSVMDPLAPKMSQPQRTTPDPTVVALPYAPASPQQGEPGVIPMRSAPAPAQPWLADVRGRKTETASSLSSLIVLALAAFPLCLSGAFPEAGLIVCFLIVIAVRTVGRILQARKLDEFGRPLERSPWAISWSLVVGLTTAIPSILVGIAACGGLGYLMGLSWFPAPPPPWPVVIGVGAATIVSWAGPFGSGARRGCRAMVASGIGTGPRRFGALLIILLGCLGAFLAWPVGSGVWSVDLLP